MTISTLLANMQLKDVIIIAVTIVGAFLIIKWVSYFLKKTGSRWDIDKTLIQVIYEIIKYVIYIIAVVIILNVLGINITAIAVSFGIVGIAVGFAARDTLSNFISGMFILADKRFKVGDIIEVSNQKGKVVKMGFRQTTIITYDKKVITIPNSSFSTNPFINHTASNTRRVDLNITIPYDMELEKTLKSLETMATGCNWVLKKPKPKVIVRELVDVGVKLTLCVWINDPWKITQYRSLLAKEAKKLLRDTDVKNE
jgi:small conductance mechanosensitive channel